MPIVLHVQVTQWDPATGKLLRTVPIPAQNVTCPAWGGEGLTDLYVTTAREATSDEVLADTPHAGAVFRVRGTGARGVASVPFTWAPSFNEL